MTTESVVFVIIDFQERLAKVMSNSEATEGNIARLVAGADALGVPLLITEQYPEKLGPTTSPIIVAGKCEALIAKTQFSCCGSEAFMRTLAALKPQHVVLAGIETHVCVYQTAVDLLAQNYAVQVVADAVTSRATENRTIALQRMRDEGVKMTSTEMILFELLDEAAGATFKRILEIVK